MAAPFYYDFMNDTSSNQQPVNPHIMDTESVRMYQRYLLNKEMSVFKWDLPEWLDQDYFLYTLYCWNSSLATTKNRRKAKR